jgi:hypothetical protein
MPKQKADPTAAIAEKKTSKSAKNIPVVELDGDTVQRYNDAKDQIEKAQKVVEALAPVLTEAGLRGVFDHNIENREDSTKQICSVRLRDKALVPPDEATVVESVLFSLTKTAKKCDSSRVETFFEDLKTTAGDKAKREDYAKWFVGVDFDTSVFIDPVTKQFSQERYDAFATAVIKVAKKFKAENPLSVHKTMGPASDFHIRRFKDFDLTTNFDLMEVLPVTTKLEPERPEVEEGEKA